MGHIQSGIALVCVLLLIGSVQPGKCSLAAYSETRSFRDALDGRSMEEAMSGPVDKDTSSYGDRTSSSGAGSSGGNQPASSGSPMMLTIPANGNLNNMMMSTGSQQQQQTIDMQEQTKSGAGSELEREAGPINGLPMDGQQQLMEQKAARQSRTGGQPMSGRLSLPAMMMMMTAANSAGTSPRSARQQQQQQESDYGTPASGNESGFGEDQSTGGTKQSNMPMPTGKGTMGGSGGEQSQSGYGKSGGSSAEQKPMNGNGAYDDQQQVTNGSPVEQQGEQQQEKGYGGQMAAKQRAMAAMLMGMGATGMRYSRPSSPAMASMGAAGQYGDKKPSSMAQNMIMSLANKAAYQQQQQKSQRQMAPPMMMGAGNRMAGYGNGNMMSAMLSANGNGMRGGMRRANQRRAERKMSPAMVNAMLNKMLSAKQQEKETGGYMKPNAMAMLMKSPAGAEMLANMMMPQMAGAMAGLPAAKRDQYKRMMMNAIMQQQQTTSGEADYAGQEQEQSNSGAPGNSYGGSQSMGAESNEYGANGMSSMMMMNGGKQSASGSGYDNDEQSQMSADGYGTSQKRAPKKMAGGDYDANQQQQQQEQEQQRQSMDGASGYEQQQMMTPAMGSTKSMGARPAGKMAMAAVYPPSSPSSSMMSGAKSAGRYGGDDSDMEQRKQMSSGRGYESMEQQQQREQAPMSSTKSAGANGYPASTEAGTGMEMMQMQAPMMSTIKMGSPMNGFRQAYSQQPMEQQQQQQEKATGYQSPASGTKSAMSPAENSYGSMAGSARPMQQSGYDQQGGMDMQQQQQDEYGAAPMGQAEPFAFDYKIEDDYGNGQYRKEESDKNGVVRGSYGYTDVSGIYRHVEYVADENGFRANIKSNEPGLSSETSGAGKSGSSSQPMPSQGQTMEPANGMASADGPDTQQQQQQQQQQMQMQVQTPYSGQSQIMGESVKKA